MDENDLTGAAISPPTTDSVQLPDPDGTPAHRWQQQNKARIQEKVEQIRAAEDGLLFIDVWSGHFVVVTKDEGRIRLWLMDQTAANTQWVQSSLDLSAPLHLEPGYLQAMVLALAWQPDPDRVLVTGLGGGCLPLVLHHHLPAVQIDCVEIAPPVAQAATVHFPLQEDDRLQIRIADAQAFLAASPEERYHILFLDLFTDGGSTPPHLTSEEFYRLCKECMHADGVLAMNLWSGAPEYPERLARLRRVFNTLYVCRIHCALSVVFASDQPRYTHSALQQRAIVQQQRRGFCFPFPDWIDRFESEGDDDSIV